MDFINTKSDMHRSKQPENKYECTKQNIQNPVHNTTKHQLYRNYLHIQDNDDINNDARTDPSDMLLLAGGVYAAVEAGRPNKEALTLSALQSSMLMSKNVSTNASARELIAGASSAA